MSEAIEIEDFLDRSETIPVIDVRAPSEFNKGHIPSAHNIYLFTDEERAKVGLIYKREGKKNSVVQGLKIVGPKLTDFVKKANKVAGNNNSLLVHCWRGGMRSSSMAWLLETVGYKVFTLKGGYKSYRRKVLNSFNEKAKIVVLGGMTGSGKTEILQELKELGEQVLDLEKLANHKGSAFGGIGEDEQPTNEQFENNIFSYLHNFDKNRPVWVEDESHLIGRNCIPNSFWDQMRQNIVIKLEIPFEQRVNRLVKEYTGFSNDLLSEGIRKISKRLGGQNSKNALNAIQEGDYKTAASISLKYYDKAYSFGLSKRDERLIHPLKSYSSDSKENAIITRDHYYQNLESN